MARSVTQRTELTVIEAGDWFPVVDVSDTAQSASGTSKKVKASNIGSGLELTPESKGALGDGSTNDAAAFNTAIAEAVSTGKLLRGNQSKIYYIGTNLTAFTGTLRIADCTFKAPNGVTMLVGAPTWGASLAISGLTTATIQGTTVTRCTMASTSGLAVGDWVSVGSSTVLWPGETNTRWFESAQIVAVATNSSIDLHRRLLGEESGLLAANRLLFKIPNYRLEATRLRFIADGNVFTASQPNRQFAIELRGGVGHRIVDCCAESWWERFIRLSSCVQSQVVNPSWWALPDIPASNEAFGYGVQEAGACYGNLTTGIKGGRCRHGYTAGAVAVATYDGTVPWRYGFVVNSAVKSSLVHGADGDCFDTHAGCAGVTFDGCASIDSVNQASGLTLPSGFQMRGYRCRVLNSTSRGGDTGFRDGSALTDWGSSLAPCVNEYAGIAASEYDQDGLLLEGTAGVTNTSVIVNGATFVQGVHGVHVDSANRFDGAVTIKGLATSELTGNVVLDNSGHATIQGVGWLLRYTGMVATPTSPIKITASAGGSWAFHDLTVMRRNDSSPPGLVEIAVAATTVPVSLGAIRWDQGDLPLQAASSTGTLNVIAMPGNDTGKIDAAGAPNTFPSRNSDGDIVETTVTGAGSLVDGVLDIQTGAATPEGITVTAAGNPTALNDVNRANADRGKGIIVNDGTNTVLLELAANMSVLSEWLIMRAAGHTGPVYGLAASGVTIDGISGVSGTPTTANMIWGTPTGTPAVNVTITPQTAGQLPLVAAGGIFQVTAASQAANLGYYIATGTPTTSSLPATKLSGSPPVEATQASATIALRPICFSMAPGRATGSLIVAETNTARFEGEDTADKVLNNNLALNGKALSGSATLGAGGTLTFPGTANFDDAVIQKKFWTVTSGFTLSAADNGKIFQCNATLTIIWPATLTNNFECGVRVATSFTVTVQSTTPGTNVTISERCYASLQGNNGVRDVYTSAPAERVTGA